MPSESSSHNCCDEIGHRAGLPGRLRLVGLRIDDDVGREEVVVARMVEIGFDRRCLRRIIVAEGFERPIRKPTRRTRRRDPASDRPSRKVSSDQR